MNKYKNVIRSQNARLKILNSLKFIPDKYMLQIEYYLKTGNFLNLKKPKRYTEKIQWYKLYYRDPLMKCCADKYLVRNYIKSKGYESILNELYAVYDSAEDIKFDMLPNSFAIKCSVGGGLNYFVQDKSIENINGIKKMVNKWLSHEYNLYGYLYGREWCYKDQPPKILIEKLLPKNDSNDIPDYKFFCFNGKVFCLYTMIDYSDDHAKGKLGFFDRNFKQLPVYRLDFAPIREAIEPPECFSSMLTIAEDLAKDFPHVRVDFYNVHGKVVFGELTFYNASGFTKFSIDKFDYIMGDQFILPQKYNA
jgi:hypothetical protein